MGEMAIASLLPPRWPVPVPRRAESSRGQRGSGGRNQLFARSLFQVFF